MFYVCSSQVHAQRQVGLLEERFTRVKAKTIPGTRSHHSFVPISTTELKISRISEDTFGTIAKVNEIPDMPPYHPGQYIAVIHDQAWYIGNVVEASEANQDFLVNFMKPKGPARSFSWPRRQDECWVPTNNVLCSVENLTTVTGRQYQVDDKLMKHIMDMYTEFVDQQSL
jgi:hypothetical protein